MCLRRAPEKYITGAALDRAALHDGSFDSSASIATGLELEGQEIWARAGRPRNLDSTYGKSQGFFFSLHKVQTGSGAHPASYLIGNGALTPEVKWHGPEADHSLPSSTEVKKGGVTIPLAPRLHGFVYK
jgi:hypothetical protein